MNSDLKVLAERIASLDPKLPGSRIDLQGSSDVVAHLVREINSLCERNEARFAELQKFSADVAHQLRTPLAVLTARLSSKDELLDTEGILRDVQWMGRLVNQLLANARISQSSQPQLQPLDLSSLGLDVVMSLAPLAIHKGKNLELRNGENPVMISGNMELAFEAVSNLVENAIAHSPSGKTVTVEIKPPNMLEVIDRGKGLQGEEITSVFERFGQGKRPTKGGAGLGLSIVSTVMENHGGSVEYIDRSGLGAVFRLVFRPWTEQP